MFLKFSGWGQLQSCSPSGFGICSQDFSASLRSNSCKRLGSRPKRAMKCCLSLLIFSRWTLIIHKPDNGTSRSVRCYDYRQLTRTRTPRRLCKIEADESWKLAKANTAFHSVFAHTSELSLNDWDVGLFPQACRDVF